MKGKSMIKDHNVVLEDSTLFHYTQYTYNKRCVRTAVTCEDLGVERAM